MGYWNKANASRLSYLLVATAAAIAAVGVLSGLAAAAPLAAAAAAGTFAYRVLAPRQQTLGWIEIIVVLLAAACAGFCCWTIVLLKAQRATSVRQTAKVAKTRVEITTPTRNQAVGQDLDGLHGTITGLAPGDAVWLTVQTVGEHTYYPAQSPCAFKAPDEWSCQRVYVGPRGLDKHRYRILVRILDGHTQQMVINGWAAALSAQRETVSYDDPLGRPGTEVTVHRFGPA
jgi:hypothetical protein